MRRTSCTNSYFSLYCSSLSSSSAVLVHRASNFSSFSSTQRCRPWKYWKVSLVIRSPTALARIKDYSASVSRNRRRTLRWFHRRLNSNWRNSSRDRVWETCWCCRMFSNVKFSFDEFVKYKMPWLVKLVRRRERKYPKSAVSTEREDNLKAKAKRRVRRGRKTKQNISTEITKHKPSNCVKIRLNLICEEMFVDFREHFLHDFLELSLKTK